MLWTYLLLASTFLTVVPVLGKLQIQPDVAELQAYPTQAFPLFLILFQHCLAHHQLVVQQAISADTLFSALLAYGQLGLRRSHEKASFYILVAYTHIFRHPCWETPNQAAPVFLF